MADEENSGSIGERVRRYREAVGLSQEDLAKAMTDAGHRWHQASVFKVEAGTRSVKIEEAVSLATTFGVSLGELVGVGGVDDETLIAIRRAQAELGRYEADLTAACHRRNDAQRALNSLLRANGREIDDEHLVFIAPDTETVGG
ncbi:MAG: helix-turn-helix domain-containing protein [Pseudonocardiaceae bacterium]